MDPNENIGRWVDERLAGLDGAAGWKPNAQRALAQLRERRQALQRRRIWIWATSAAGVAACLGVLALVAPQACATPRGCTDGLFGSARPKPVVSTPVVSTPAPPPPVVNGPAVPAPAPRKTAAANFRLTGAPTAPIVCEIYTDYECPACARFYRDIIPQLVSEYVQTGKVQILHRDFPLPRRQYSKNAARWANAAGRLGYYDAAVNRIFASQALWSGNGDVESQLTGVLPPAVLHKARALVDSDPTLDESVSADIEMGRADELRQTPTLVIVFHGKRQAIPGPSSFELLKSYLDDLLAR